MERNCKVKFLKVLGGDRDRYWKTIRHVARFYRGVDDIVKV